jgi:hypothetical protein
MDRKTFKLGRLDNLYETIASLQPIYGKNFRFDSLQSSYFTEFNTGQGNPIPVFAHHLANVGSISLVRGTGPVLGTGASRTAKMGPCRAKGPKSAGDDFLVDLNRVTELKIGNQTGVLVLLKTATRPRQALPIPLLPGVRGKQFEP